MEIANLTAKGSKSFYNLIRAKKNLENKIHLREQKWHQSLGCIFSVQIWSERYRRCQKIKYDNKLKWLVYQVTRGSQFSNVRVNKFMPAVSKDCTFCTLEGTQPPISPETLEHLYYGCNSTHNFWNPTLAWLSAKDCYIDFDRSTLLFGTAKHPPNSKENILIQLSKNFLWKMRCSKKLPTFLIFRKYLKFKIELLRNSLEYDNKKAEAESWKSIHDTL